MKKKKNILAKIKRLGYFNLVLAAWWLCAIYFIAIASPRYVPEAQVYIKSSKSMTIQDGMPNLSMMAMGVSQASPDLLLLQNFMHSQDMLTSLDKLIGLKAHYSDKSVDIISRLSSRATQEEFLEYYREHLELEVDAESGILIVKAEAFDPEYALKLTRLLLNEGERYINEVGQKIAITEIGFVEKEVQRAAANLNAAREELLAFQSEYQTLSPEEEGLSFLKVIGGLRAELVGYKTELKALQSFMNEKSSEIIALKAKIKAIEDQIKQEEAKSTSSGVSSLGTQNAKFQALKLKVEFAVGVYSTTIRALEQTRVEVYRQMKHLVRIQNPLVPDSALYPKVIYNLFSIFMLLSILYGIIYLVVATVKEQRNA